MQYEKMVIIALTDITGDMFYFVLFLLYFIAKLNGKVNNIGCHSKEGNDGADLCTSSSMVSILSVKLRRLHLTPPSILWN